MAKIFSITPSRFREGDVVTIAGAAFSPTSGANDVTIDQIPAAIFSETETELEVEVPVGVTKNAYVGVLVQRNDTGDNDATSAFSLADADDLLDGTAQAPGQVPGEVEAANLNLPVPDVPQARDYEIMTTLAEWLAREQLDLAGHLWGSTGGPNPPEALLLPPAPNEVLIADPPAFEGISTALHPRRLTWHWGKRIDAGAGNNGPMVANGDLGNPSVAIGELPAGAAGTVVALTVLVEEFAPGDTLDLVELVVNGVVAFTSGAGLGLTTFYAAAPAVAVLAADRLQVNAYKLGAAGIMRLRATAEVE